MKYERTASGYAQYLESDHWDKLRTCVLERDGNKCVRCGSRQWLQAHHKFYRDDWEQAEVSDLETLCRPCHQKEHPDKQVSVQVNVVVRVATPSEVFHSFKELAKARSERKISREVYLKWAPLLKRKRNKKVRRPFKFKRKKQKHPKACKPWHYNAHPTGMRWVQRGTSSN